MVTSYSSVPKGLLERMQLLLNEICIIMAKLFMGIYPRPGYAKGSIAPNQPQHID